MTGKIAVSTACWLFAGACLADVFALYRPTLAQDWKWGTWQGFSPLAGRLDGTSPSDVATELALAESAGIKVLLVEFTVKDGVPDRHEVVERGFMKAAGSGGTKIAACYTGSSARELEELARYAAANWADSPVYLKVGGKACIVSKENVPARLPGDVAVRRFSEFTIVRVDGAGFGERLALAGKSGGDVLVDSWNKGNDSGGGALLPDLRGLNLNLLSVWRVFGGDRDRMPVCAMRRFWDRKAPNGKPSSVEVPDFGNVRYGPHVRQCLDVWLPVRAAPAKGFPVAVYIHGGGWDSGDHLSEVSPHIARCRRYGAALVSVAYRTLQDARDDKAEPWVRYPLSDAVAAVRHIKARARELRIDPERIMLFGGSAGACSSLYASLQGDCELGIRVVHADVPQTSMDPEEVVEWIPNQTYGGMAFGCGTFGELLARRGKWLPWIEKFSPAGLARLCTPEKSPFIYYRANSLPPPGTVLKDTAHAGMYCVKFKEICDARGIRFERGGVDDALARLTGNSVDGPASAGVAPFGRFAAGMLSSTRPEGWLKEFCRTQREGLTGHPEAMCYPYDSCLWAGRISREGRHGDSWWRYEQTGYYVDGLLRLGYALEDAELVAKGERCVDWTLDNATEEGQLGDPCLWDGANHRLCKGAEMWPMAVFFRAMKAKYESTGDVRIPEALRRYYLLYPVDIVREGRNCINVEGLTWTYALTGDRRLLELARSAWESRAGENESGESLNPAYCSSDNPVYMHGVTYCEGLKIPLLLAAYTGERKYLDQALNIHRKLVRDHMLPDGCPSSTEQTRGNSVHWGHETCCIADYTWSLGYFLETTGDAAFADAIEKCVFNAGTGAVTPDFRALQYFSNVNQFAVTSDSNHNPYANGGTWAQYRPTHQTECCAGNVHRIFPNYVSRMWLKDRDGNPVAALYGPSEADYGWVKIRQETRYPFSGRIRFVFSMKEPRRFAFTYRVPGWCVSNEKRGKFVRIERTFADGDVLEFDFPMEVVFEKPGPRRYVVKDPVSKWVGRIEGARPQGTVVRRGPLLFAWPVPELRTEDDRSRHGKKSADPAFKCWNLRPAAPFGYALAGTAAEAVCEERGGTGSFDARNPPVTVSVPVRRIRWELDDGRFTPDLPLEAEPLDDGKLRLELVPYGAACLRLAAFPELSGKERR